MIDILKTIVSIFDDKGIKFSVLRTVFLAIWEMEQNDQNWTKSFF